MTHSQALWTSFLGGMPHLREVYLSFCVQVSASQKELHRHRVPHVLALLKAAEAAERKLHVQVFTGVIRWVCFGEVPAAAECALLMHTWVDAGGTFPWRRDSAGDSSQQHRSVSTAGWSWWTSFGGRFEKPLFAFAEMNQIETRGH